jgi:hypothetical protein
MPEKSTCDNCDQPAVLHTVKTVGDDGLGTMDICDPCEDSQYDDLIAEPKPERKPERTNEPLALVVNKANLAIARLVEKVPESRYALRSLNLTDKHTEVTDGHMAVRVSLPNVAMVQLPEIPACPVSPREGFKPFAIDATDAKKIEAIIPAHRSLSILNYAHVNVGDNGTAQFATTELDREPTPDGNGELIAPTWRLDSTPNYWRTSSSLPPRSRNSTIRKLRLLSVSLSLTRLRQSGSNARTTQPDRRFTPS